MDQMQYAVIKWTSDGNKLSIEHLKSIVEPKKPWNMYRVGDTGKAKYGKGEWECQILAIGPSRKSLQGSLNESLLKMDQLMEENVENMNNETTGTGQTVALKKRQVNPKQTETEKAGQDVALKKRRVSIKQTEREKAVVEKTASANEVLALREISNQPLQHVPVISASAETTGSSAPNSTTNIQTTNANPVDTTVTTTAVPACLDQDMGMQGSSHVLAVCGDSYDQGACGTTQTYNNVESTPWTMTSGFGGNTMNTSYQDSWYSPNRNYTMTSDVMGSAFGSLYGHETPATTPRPQYYQTPCHSCCETVSALQRRVEVLEEEIRRNKKKCRSETKEPEKPVDDSNLQGKDQYIKQINNSATVSIAVQTLLTANYTVDELLSCSVMGGQNVKGDTKPGLDSKRRSLIEVAILEKFDTSLTTVRNIMRDRLKLIRRRHFSDNEKN